ncbi:MAG TPA: S41 family peptidase, partial [Pelobium sp.]
MQIQHNGPSDQASKFIDEFKNIVKTYSIYKDSLDWNKIESDIAILSKGIETTNHAKLVTEYIIGRLKSVGDNHSFSISPSLTKQMAKENLVLKQPYSKLIAGKIGYIFIPGFSSRDRKLADEFAERIQGLIRELDTKNNIEGWILDFQENSGGNKHAMIAGLGPL